MTVLFNSVTKPISNADAKQEYATNQRKRSSDDFTTSMSNPKEEKKCQAMPVCSNKDNVNVDHIGLYVYTEQVLKDSKIARFFW